MKSLENIKKKINKELKSFLRTLEKEYDLSSLSPTLYYTIKEFLLRSGKRVRPTLFILGYSGYSDKLLKNLYRSALSIELMHAFFLVHDDIMDRSDLRRGKPTLHKVFEKKLSKKKNINFRGEDLGIIAGDIINSLALKAFISIDIDGKAKEKALNLLNEAVIYTGAGQFLEFMNLTKDINKISRDNINKVYDYKTAFYTFSFPLAIGATLSGVSDGEMSKLKRFGLHFGRAFQIKDDIIGTFGDKKRTGKSVTSDLEEGKRTILLYEAYRLGNAKEKKILNAFLKKTKKTKNDFKTIKGIIKSTGSLDHAKNEISLLSKKSKTLLKSTKLKPSIKDLLSDYSEKILKV